MIARPLVYVRKLLGARALTATRLATRTAGNRQSKRMENCDGNGRGKARKTMKG